MLPFSAMRHLRMLWHHLLSILSDPALQFQDVPIQICLTLMLIQVIQDGISVYNKVKFNISKSTLFKLLKSKPTLVYAVQVFSLLVTFKGQIHISISFYLICTFVKKKEKKERNLKIPQPFKTTLMVYYVSLSVFMWTIFLALHCRRNKFIFRKLKS